MRETFHKSERLCSRTLIRTLFRDGRPLSGYPFRVHWQFNPHAGPAPVQVLIGAPKSLFPKATDRNLLKRRIREAYRKNKHILCQPLADRNQRILLSITYNTRDILPFSEIRHKIILLLQRLHEAVEKHTE